MLCTGSVLAFDMTVSWVWKARNLLDSNYIEQLHAINTLLVSDTFLLHP